MIKKRWVALYVENEIGVLAEISGLFAAKAYNLDSLTVGETADKTVSRMTIGIISDDALFEQIKKQLNRMVNVIRVVDLTEHYLAERELAFFRIEDCSASAAAQVMKIAERHGLQVVSREDGGFVLQSVVSKAKTDEILRIFSKMNLKVDIARSGSVAI